ncbi:MAG: hypothetical protein QM729_09785 [Solirubrobacterales bacterium]
MSDPVAGQSEDPRIEELLRLNAELAAEIRSLREGRARPDRPVAAAAPTARRLDRALAERDRLAAEVAELRARLEAESGRQARPDVRSGGLVGLIRRAGGRARRSLGR